MRHNSCHHQYSSCGFLTSPRLAPPTTSDRKRGSASPHKPSHGRPVGNALAVVVWCKMEVYQMIAALDRTRTHFRSGHMQCPGRSSPLRPARESPARSTIGRRREASALKSWWTSTFSKIRGVNPHKMGYFALKIAVLPNFLLPLCPWMLDRHLDP